MKAAVTRFHVRAGQERAFERFMREAIATSKGYRGEKGAVLLRSAEEPRAYLLVAFWVRRADRIAFLRATNARSKSRQFVTGTPQTEWFDALVRLQAELVRPGK